MSINLQRIDEFLIQDHPYLEKNDYCYFWTEYTARKGYNFSDANSLIFNFKKPLSRKNRSDWVHKSQSIKKIANTITSLNVWEKLRQFTWVPMPPSKVSSDPHYDDRLIQVLKEVNDHDPNFDFRELILLKESSHF